jgi:hypothetical protein
MADCLAHIRDVDRPLEQRTCRGVFQLRVEDQSFAGRRGCGFESFLWKWLAELRLCNREKRVWT